jgi:acetyl esterase/lipase
MRSFFVFFLLLVVSGAQVSLPTPCGVLVGDLKPDHSASFLGVPFTTSPPRLHHSTPLPCPSGPPVATSQLNLGRQSPACPQPSPPPQGISENCLFLNIHTPNINSHNLPVLVYIHGGGNYEGSSALGGDDGDDGYAVLARRMQAVVVPIQYRLGLLGFLVAEGVGVTGNFGVGDCLAALTFIAGIARAVGGDPGRVTVMGQSSGGTNILALLAAPGARGLFQSAISLSGSPNISSTVEFASQLHSETFLAGPDLCGGAEDLRACLMAAPVANFTAALSTNLSTVNPPNLPLSPVGNSLVPLVIVDGQVVTQPVLEAVANGVTANLFIETCQGETDPTLDSVDYLTNTTAYGEWLESYFGQQGFPSPRALASEILDIYSDLLSEGGSVEIGFEQFLSDLGVVCGNDAIYELARKSSPGFVVRRSHLDAGPTNPWQRGGDRKVMAFHTFDFPILATDLFWGDYTPTKQDLALGDLLVRLWTDFQQEKSECLAINKGPALSPCNSAARCKRLAQLGFGPEFWWVN